MTTIAAEAPPTLLARIDWTNGSVTEVHKDEWGHLTATTKRGAARMVDERPIATFGDMRALFQDILQGAGMSERTEDDFGLACRLVRQDIADDAIWFDRAGAIMQGGAA